MLNRVSFNVPKIGYSFKGNINKVNHFQLNNDIFMSCSDKTPTEQRKQREQLKGSTIEQNYRLKMYDDLKDREDWYNEKIKIVGPEKVRTDYLIGIYQDYPDLDTLNSKREQALKLAEFACPSMAEVLKDPVDKQELDKFSDIYKELYLKQQRINPEAYTRQEINDFENRFYQKAESANQRFHNTFPVLDKIVFSDDINTEVSTDKIMDSIFNDYEDLYNHKLDGKATNGEKYKTYKKIATNFENLGDNLKELNHWGASKVIEGCYEQSIEMLSLSKGFIENGLLLEGYKWQMSEMNEEFDSMLQDMAESEQLGIHKKIARLNNKIIAQRNIDKQKKTS